MAPRRTSTSSDGPMSSVSLPTLHADIFIEIMSHVPDDHAARFMLIGSRIMYHEAILKTLKRVKLLHAQTIGGFLQVLNSPLSHGRSRYRAVRAIEFGYLGTIQSATEKSLGEAISQLSNLRDLSILYAEDLLHDFQTLSPILSNLVSIQSISVAGVGLRFCRMLKNMKSRLVYISMDFFLEDEDDIPTMYDHLAPDLYSTHHPVALLSHMSNSLEELHLSNCYPSVFGNIVDDIILTYPHVYPKIRALHMNDSGYTFDHFPRVLLYVRAFPLLAELGIAIRTVRDAYKESSDEDMINSTRAINVFDLFHSGHASSWTHLDQFVGCLHELYMLGIACPVTRLCFLSPLQLQKHLSMLAACLKSSRPTHLKLRGYNYLLAGTLDSGVTPGSLADVLRGPGADGIRSLVVDIILDPFLSDGRDPRDMDVAHQLDTFAAALKSIPLTRLRLGITVSGVNSQPDRPLFPTQSLPLSSGAPCIAETSAAHIDVPAFLRTLCAAIPTLTDAYVILYRRPAAKLRTSILDDSATSDDTGDPNGGCLHWARVPATCETDPQCALESEDRSEMFELG